MNVAINFDPDFQAMTCAGCGCSFAVPSALVRRYNNDGAWLRCPNPECPWPKFHRTESEVDKLKKQLEAERARAQRANDARQWAEKSLSATKGQVTRLRKRVANGCCPCCQRSFANLQRHMATKHPDFAAAEVAP